MADERVEIAWTRDKHQKQRVSLACPDGESAGKVYQRLVAVLQALLVEETRRVAR